MSHCNNKLTYVFFALHSGPNSREIFVERVNANVDFVDNPSFVSQCFELLGEVVWCHLLETLYVDALDKRWVVLATVLDFAETLQNRSLHKERMVFDHLSGNVLFIVSSDNIGIHLLLQNHSVHVGDPQTSQCPSVLVINNIRDFVFNYVIFALVEEVVEGVVINLLEPTERGDAVPHPEVKVQVVQRRQGDIGVQPNWAVVIARVDPQGEEVSCNGPDAEALGNQNAKVFGGRAALANCNPPRFFVDAEVDDGHGISFPHGGSLTVFLRGDYNIKGGSWALH
jgi:hypothetical protein